MLIKQDQFHDLGKYLVKIDPFFLNNEWPLKNLSVNSANIFSDNTDKKKLNRRKEK